MFDILSILCLLIGVGVLSALVWIDLRARLLPNILTLSLAMSGFAFHTAALFHYGDVSDLALGAFIGGGSLYLIRMAGNMFYKTDTLGLGDVKLMAAGGLWLGSYHILLALIIGAIMGLVHGAAMMIAQRMRTGERVDVSRFSLPAGPGFAAGLLIVALAKFAGLAHLSL